MGKGDPIGDGGGQPLMICPLDAETFQALPCNARLSMINAIPNCAVHNTELCDAGTPGAPSDPGGGVGGK